MNICFHCGGSVVRGDNLTANIHGIDHPLCGAGCQAAATLVTDMDLDTFYIYRQGQLPSQPASVSDTDWQHLDVPTTLPATTLTHSNGSSQANIKIEGIYSSACGWLIQNIMLQHEGIKNCSINTASQTATVSFNPNTIKLSEIYSLVERLGYQPKQLEANHNAATKCRQKSLKQISVAASCLALITALSLLFYWPDYFPLAAYIRSFLLFIVSLVAAVLYVYPGLFLVKNALRGWRHKNLTVDVPIALAISLTFVIGLYQSFTQQNPGYFAVMALFILLLLIGRLITLGITHQRMDLEASLFALVPVSTEKLIDDQHSESIPMNQVTKGDRLIIKTGHVVPIDGQVTAGRGQVNESRLSGDTKWISKRVGDWICAGSEVTSGELVVTASVDNKNNFIAQLGTLIHQEKCHQPTSMQQADKLAGYFTTVALVLSTGTALWYALFQTEAMIPVVLALLIAACPGVFKLATSTALTAAEVRLLRQGMLIKNLDAIVQFKHIKHWVFDKTGTLSEDRLSVQNQHIITPTKNLEAIAASLQQISNHPLASAFKHLNKVELSQAQAHTGLGVNGQIGTQLWQMGSLTWMESLGVNPPDIPLDPLMTHVYLACDGHLVAVYELHLPIRQGAKSLISTLHQQQINTAIISGDQNSTVKHWAKMLNITQCEGLLTPAEKAERIKELQAHDHPCVVVGDGDNDAPMLKQADFSISLKHGAYVTHAAADMIVLDKSLSPIISTIQICQQTPRIIKQNLIWALTYNLSVIPLAMLGYVSPWVAAIVMPLGALLVVLNSRRLLND